MLQRAFMIIKLGVQPANIAEGSRLPRRGPARPEQIQRKLSLADRLAQPALRVFHLRDV